MIRPPGSLREKIGQISDFFDSIDPTRTSAGGSDIGRLWNAETASLRLVPSAEDAVEIRQVAGSIATEGGVAQSAARGWSTRPDTTRARVQINWKNPTGNNRPNSGSLFPWL